MAFTPQNDSGTVLRANAYVTVEEFRAYQADRGNDVSAHTDPVVQAAIIKATDYLDGRYRYIGVQLHDDQGTQFPRLIDRHKTTEIPDAIKRASFSLALRVLSGVELSPDPTFNAGGQVVEQSNKVGPLETTVKFAASTAGETVAPSFSDVEHLLRASGLLGSRLSSHIVRG